MLMILITSHPSVTKPAAETLSFLFAKRSLSSDGNRWSRHGSNGRHRQPPLSSIPNLFLGFFSTSAAIKRKVVETMIKVQWRIGNLSTNFLKLEREESIQMQSEIYRPLKYNRNICKRCTMNVMFLFKNSANDEKFIKSAWNDSWNCRELNLSKYQPLNAFIVRISDWKPVADPPTVPLFKINASASSSRF